MRMAIVAFAFGIWLCQRMAALPPAPVPAGLLAAGLAGGAAAALVGGRRRRPPLGTCAALALFAALAGFAWAAWRAEGRLADALPETWEGRDVAVTGRVAGLPEGLGRGARFVFEVEAAEGPVPHRLLLSWYARRGDAGTAPVVRAGERWQLVVRLKRPHGFANPHGFDYEGWLLQHDLRATGYVREAAQNRRLAAFVATPATIVHRLREAVRDRFFAILGREVAACAPPGGGLAEPPPGGGCYAGVLAALAVGDEGAIPDAQWDLFRRTGIAHLVAISGSHISLVAVLAAALAGALWRRFPALLLRCPVRRAAAVAGLAAAGAYSLLAGFGIPVQRAFIMLAVAAGALVVGREVAPSRILAAALLAVLAADPWAVLAAGFWLSFGAVGAILFVLGGRLAAVRGWRAALRTQLAVGLATVPALLALFQALSLVSPIANAVAIPLVGFVVVPLALVAAVVPWAPVLVLAHWLVAVLASALGWLAALPLAYWQQAAPPAWLAAAGMAGAGWLLMPRGTPGRATGVLALVPLVAWSPARPAPGEFVLTVLDVGNGLAVHVQTAAHDLMYDTGPAYGGAADAGTRVLLPYLAAGGVTRLDRLVVSHDDIDHFGGAASLLAGMPVDSVATTLPPGHPLLAAAAGRAVDCRAGLAWRWDGVAFDVLHPGEDGPPPRGDNNRSCVVRVAGAGGSVLLAGDIEAAAEAELVRRYGAALASSVMVVAHHGSRSSSSPSWVAAVRPAAAIFPVGYRNRFHHPHPAVWARWAAAGAREWRTDRQGAIRVEAAAGGVTLSAEREREPRYWYGR